MIQMLRRPRQIRRRSHPRERLEIVDEVGLVVVAAVEGDLGPVHTGFAVDTFEDALEAADTAEGLGRQTDLVAKQLDEAALAEADAIHNTGDGGHVRSPANMGARQADSGMQLQRPDDLIQQRALPEG